jgi:nucleoside-diphosphate-sugar epimerase
MNNHNDVPKVALVGAGYIADYHVAGVRALEHANLIAVCDLSKSRATRFAKTHGIEGVYTDIGQMLKDAAPDAVHVLTPPNAHVDPCRAILEGGADVLAEKPLAHTSADCHALTKLAASSSRALGVSHNFLFFPAYERLVDDLRRQKFGELDHVDIVWNKELGQLRGGPFGAWMLADPRNILFEVAPHAFAHAAHLVGMPDEIAVHPRDVIELPNGQPFFRRWEILAWKGRTTVRIRLSFVPGYPEHYVHVRGFNGTGHVDFQQNTYVHAEHTPQLLDIDRFTSTTASARDSVVQATGTLANFVLSKAGLAPVGGPFDVSIARAIEGFYATRTSTVDERLSPGLAADAVTFAERVAEQVQVPETKATSKPTAPRRDARPPTVLVIGGTGFIGQALVRKLVDAGHGVRVMARNPSNLPASLVELGVDAQRGDFTDIAAVERSLEGIEVVYHLARGFGNTWAEYLEGDVEPTSALARACQARGVRRFIYASSIAIYDAGRSGHSITEETKPVGSMLRANPYARSKAENEANLLEMYRSEGLPLVIVRPGIVLGHGGNPLHWGIAAWPHETVCRLYGDGTHPLPIVLVDDVADAMVATLDAPNAIGQSYNLAGPPCITANDYLDEIEHRAGVRLRRVATPSGRAFAEEVVKWAIKAMGGDKTVKRPSYIDWRGRTFASPFDCSKAIAELSWSPVMERDAIVAAGIWEPVDEFFT